MEIIKLADKLQKAKIYFLVNSIFDGYKITIPQLKCSAVQHNYSYGANKNLIEIMGLLTKEELEQDEVIGYLTADEVFERIKKALEV